MTYGPLGCFCGTSCLPGNLLNFWKPGVPLNVTDETPLCQERAQAYLEENSTTEPCACSSQGSFCHPQALQCLLEPLCPGLSAAGEPGSDGNELLASTCFNQVAVLGTA